MAWSQATNHQQPVLANSLPKLLFERVFFGSIGEGEFLRLSKGVILVLLTAGIGAFFFLLHLVTARRFAPLMPDRMVSPWWGLRSGRLVSKRLGLVAGPVLSLFLAVYTLAEGVQPGAYAPLIAVQTLIYLVVLTMHSQNARAKKEEDQNGKL